MSKERSRIPLESWEMYQLLWVTNWYDWELSGIAQRNDKRVFFDCIEATGRADRLFAVYDPPAEIWARIDEEHEDFNKYVGTHWDFQPSEDGVCCPSIQRPYSEHHKFYDKWPKDSISMKPEWQIALADSRLSIE